MKKFFLLLSIGLLTSFLTNASPITPEEALARISQNQGTRSTETLKPQLIKTIESWDKEPEIYLFGYKEKPGYMILSADDAVPALLGYSEETELEISNLPSQLEWWLSEYGRQISWLRERGVSQPYGSRSIDSEQASWSSISPLLKTQWNQDAPYNNLCPEYQGTRMPTGCVATAMAQVMKYYNYPETGQGSISYKPSVNGSPLVGELSMDFSEQSFDWKNMLDTYVQGQYTNAQAEAVAYLMKACGYSVEMTYNLDGSGAMTPNQAAALVNNFKYDPSLQLLTRDYYTYDDWAKIVYENLAEGHPVIYGGNGPFTGGHSFVCDGYSQNGYFHFNWGWSGLSDGYFLLDILDPINQGIGGNVGGYSFNQDILVNIKPMEGDATSSAVPIVAQQGSLTGSIEDQYLLLGLINEGYYGFLGWMNLTYQNFTVDMGVILESVTDGNTSTYYYSSVNYLELDFEPYWYYMYDYDGELYPVAIDLSRLRRNGTYKVTLATKPSSTLKNDWTPVEVTVGNYNYIYITKSDTGVSVSYEYPVNNPDVVDFQLLTPLYYGAPGIAKATFTNNSDFQFSTGVGIMAFNSEDEEVFESDSFLFTIDSGETIEKEWEFDLNQLIDLDGDGPFELDLYLFDLVNYTIYDVEPLHVTMQKNPGLGDFQASVSFDNTTQAGNVWQVTDPSALKINVSLSVEEGYFGYPLLLGIGESVPKTDEVPFFYGYLTTEAAVFPDYPYTRQVSLSFDSMKEGLIYYAFMGYIYDDHLYWIEPAARFSYNSSGVDLTENTDGSIAFTPMISGLEISSPAGIKEVTTSDLAGRRIPFAVDYSNGSAYIRYEGAASGMIIVTATDGAHNVRTYKAMVK